MKMLGNKNRMQISHFESLHTNIAVFQSKTS